MGKLRVKIVPSSSRDSIVGWLGESLKIKVKAPPEQGKANAAVIELLASILEIEQKRIAVVNGHLSPVKVLMIEGFEDAEIVALLQGVI
jgi:uncharacterized protein (TIGR00251 family)